MDSEAVQLGKVATVGPPTEIQVSISESDPNCPPASIEDVAPTTRPPPILCLGMARTGTASLCAALRTIGLEKVHHGTETGIGDEFTPMWRLLDRAADATFPNLPTYTGTPFTRTDWDEVFGGYDAVTDVASFYATSLLRAYPDAKVILVERDIEAWLESASPVFAEVASRLYHRLVHAIERRTGSAAGGASIKFRMGWTDAEKPRDCLRNMRASYIRHYKEIRAAVPKGQLLEYKLSDGWAPLCEFLGREVPDAPFPHLNDSKAYEMHVKRARDAELKKLAKTIFSIR